MSNQPKSEFSSLRSAAYPILSFTYLLVIFGVPLALCVILWQRSGSKLQTLVLFVCPIVYSFCFALLAGVLSVAHQKGIISGKFPRDVGHYIYFHRRLYGLCWTSLFYFKPVYFLVLSVEPVRKLVFLAFGYRGCLDFTIYPDTWIRDLPLLQFGRGAYISNKATLGTNIVLTNGRILVGPISVDEGAVVGHASKLAPGCRIGKKAEVGVGCGLAINVCVEMEAKIGPMCGIDSGACIGVGATIGGMCCIGARARVEAGIYLPIRSLIPKRAHVANQTESDLLVSPTEFPALTFNEPLPIGLAELE